MRLNIQEKESRKTTAAYKKSVFHDTARPRDAPEFFFLAVTGLLAQYSKLTVPTPKRGQGRDFQISDASLLGYTRVL
jgi:hypothetical protein